MSNQPEDPVHSTALENAPPKPAAAAFFGAVPERARTELEQSVAEAARKFGFADREKAGAARAGEAKPEDDADLLRRLLADQRAATLQAQAEALALQKSLAEAEARLAKTKGQLGVIPVRLEDSHGRLRPDAVLVRAQWERAKKDLQRSLVARTRDAEQANAKLAAVTEALAAARETTAHDALRSRKKTPLRILAWLAIAGSVCGAALLAVMFIDLPKASLTNRAPAPATAPTQTSSAPGIPATGRTDTFDNAEFNRQDVIPHDAIRHDTNRHGTNRDDTNRDDANRADVTNEISRLSRALGRFQGVDPEVVLRAVNKRAPATALTPCAFEWKDGEPALQFGERRGAHSTIVESLSRCAAAVEKFQ